MIHIVPLRKNDVSPEGGKQFELGKDFIDTYGWESGHTYTLTINYNTQTITTVMEVRSNSRSENPREGVDCKEYSQNNNDSTPFKDFLIGVLGLNMANIGKTYLIFEAIDDSGLTYNLKTAPEKITQYPFYDNNGNDATIIFSSSNISDFAIFIIRYLADTDCLGRLGSLIETKSYNQDIKKLKLVNGSFSLAGLFLRNAVNKDLGSIRGLRPNDWCQEPVVFGGESLLLTKEWYPDGLSRLSIIALSNLIKMSLDNEFFITYNNDCYYFCSKKSMTHLQKIYYGAPGTGKSNEIKELTSETPIGRLFAKNCTIRTTFHPDSDYSSFVGAYKPYWDERQGKVLYGFRPQSFIKAYVKAWTNPNDNVALIVEEINRGNCAQIFGDIFQLLDRESNGLSKYPIECDIDLEGFLKTEFATGKQLGSSITEDDYSDKKDVINDYYSKHYDDAFDKIKSGKILVLPQNLSILATMNTSDQSLFPMDSAFKRRWEWIYEPITEGIDKNGNKLEWKIKIDDNKKVNWWKFLERINEEIRELTLSEDKQLGYFILNPDLDDKTISIDLFVGKVIFYLWNEIFKDYAFDRKCCKTADEKDIVYFANFYNKETRKVDIDVVINFFEKLKKNNNDDSLIEESSNLGDNAGQGATTDSPAPQPGAQMTLDM